MRSPALMMLEQCTREKFERRDGRPELDGKMQTLSALGMGTY